MRSSRAAIHGLYSELARRRWNVHESSEIPPEQPKEEREKFKVFDNLEFVQAACASAGLKLQLYTLAGMPRYFISSPDPAKAAMSRIEIWRPEQHEMLRKLIDAVIASA